MDWKMISLNERIEPDSNGRFTRYKQARFDVNGTEHTLRISMPDFDAGRTNAMVQVEVDKIYAALGKGKK